MAPALKAASKVKARTVVSIPNIAAGLPVRLFRRVLFHGLERVGQPLLLAVIAGAIPEMRPADAGRYVVAYDAACRVLALDFVEEEILGDDDVSLHPHDLGHMGDAPRAVAQAGSLNDDVH